MLMRVKEAIPGLVESLPVEVARDLLDVVASAAPRDIPRYPKVLGLYRIKTQGGVSGAGIFPDQRAYLHRIGEKEAGFFVLKIVPRRRKGLVISPAAALLEKYNPWTVTTIPWMPPRALADVQSSKVSAFEVKRVEQARMGDRRDVRRELLELGIADLRKLGATSFERETSRDLVAEVVRSEFGIGRSGRKHWRLAVDHLGPIVKNRAREAISLIVTSSSGYTSQETLPMATSSQVERAQKFQAAIMAGTR